MNFKFKWIRFGMQNITKKVRRVLREANSATTVTTALSVCMIWIQSGQTEILSQISFQNDSQ